MKKYVKPELFYEHFELSQHIADCAWELQYADKYSCVANGDPKYQPGYEELGLFTETARCSFDEKNYQDYCYEAGADGVNVFIS